MHAVRRSTQVARTEFIGPADCKRTHANTDHWIHKRPATSAIHGTNIIATREAGCCTDLSTGSLVGRCSSRPTSTPASPAVSAIQHRCFTGTKKNQLHLGRHLHHIRCQCRSCCNHSLLRVQKQQDRDSNNGC